MPDVTDVLELLGLLTLVFAGAVYLSRFDSALGVAAAGAGLLLVSFVIVASRRRRGGRA